MDGTRWHIVSQLSRFPARHRIPSRSSVPDYEPILYFGVRWRCTRSDLPPQIDEQQHAICLVTHDGHQSESEMKTRGVDSLPCLARAHGSRLRRLRVPCVVAIQGYIFPYVAVRGSVLDHGKSGWWRNTSDAIGKTLNAALRHESNVASWQVSHPVPSFFFFFSSYGPKPISYRVLRVTVLSSALQHRHEGQYALRVWTESRPLWDGRARDLLYPVSHVASHVDSYEDT
ncbi:hypothetical protein GGR52DRAFT_186109 [Hypoxylon sp. FL1284]|nr:hypothetical protein GGR52DRAFT_186109 [Hypoxylon sp. FL1284]